MYRFALRPKWIASHVLVALLLISTILLGFWQLDRLDGRKKTNSEITARLSSGVADVTELVSLEDGYGIGQQLRFRLATATGIYVPHDEVLILNRSHNGAPGYWVLTPLVLDDGQTLAVNRGWVPFSPGPSEPRPGTEPPAGAVRVQGVLRETVVAEGIQSADPAEGVLDALARPDLARLEQQLDYELLPVYLQLEGQDPAGADLPVLVPRPQLDEGPHFAYAMQWFIFAAIGLVGYPLVLRRVAHSEGREGRHSDIPVDYL